MVSKIELHYYLQNDSHSMDAFIRNRCEASILAIIKEVSIITGIQLKVETEAYVEGGLIERIKLLAKNQFILGLLSGILINVISDTVNTDRELNDLEKQKLRLEIRKLEKDLNEQNPNAITVDVNEASSLIAGSLKIIKHKSNFYKSLASYGKITQVSFQKLDEENRPIGSPKSVMKEEFNNYVLESDDLPEETDSEASIEIISPVLKPGNFKWKGFYSKNGSSIDFFMKDKDFMKDVKSKKVSFRNGSCIDCILEINRKLSEQGEIINSSYTVLKVIEVRDIDGTYETPQGKKYKKELEEKKKQLSLFNQA